MENPDPWTTRYTRLAEANGYKVGKDVKGVISHRITGGFLVNAGPCAERAFLPLTEVGKKMSKHLHKSPKEFIGKEIECRIIDVNEFHRNLILSQKVVEDEKKEKDKRAVLGSVRKGDFRRGIVENIVDYGAFVDIGGFDALLHVTKIPGTQHPSDVLKKGQEINVEIIDVDVERGRIGLAIVGDVARGSNP